MDEEVRDDRGGDVVGEVRDEFEVAVGGDGEAGAEVVEDFGADDVLAGEGVKSNDSAATFLNRTLFNFH